MKIEKLTENKIRVIVSTEDLKENDIDFNLLMNKSMETQNLFFEILERAEEELDFHTDGYKLLIEAFSSSDEKLISYGLTLAFSTYIENISYFLTLSFVLIYIYLLALKKSIALNSFKVANILPSFM